MSKQDEPSVIGIILKASFLFGLLTLLIVGAMCL